MDRIDVSAKELSEYLDMTERNVRRLANDGVLVKAGYGKYDLKESIKNYLGNLKTKDETKNKTQEQAKAEFAIEQALHERSKRRKTDLIVAEMEKKLHRADDVKIVWNNIVYAAKSKMLTLPTKISPRLAGMDDPAEIQTVLKAEVSEILRDIAQYDVRMFVKDFKDDADGDE